MSVIRVGSTSKYAEGWDTIFSGTAKKSGVPSRAKAAKKPVKKSAKKPVAKAKKASKARRG